MCSIFYWILIFKDFSLSKESIVVVLKNVAIRRSVISVKPLWHYSNDKNLTTGCILVLQHVFSLNNG